MRLPCCSDAGAGVSQLKHTFVITEASSARKLGCCLRYPHQRGAAEWAACIGADWAAGKSALSIVPECVVVLSSHPWPTMFFAVAQVSSTAAGCPLSCSVVQAIAELRCGGSADSVSGLLEQLAASHQQQLDAAVSPRQYTATVATTQREGRRSSLVADAGVAADEDLLSGTAGEQTFCFERIFAQHGQLSKQELVGCAQPPIASLCVCYNPFCRHLRVSTS